MLKVAIVTALLVSGLFLTAKPASAACQTVRVQRQGYSSVRTVCTSSNGSVVNNSTAIANTGGNIQIGGGSIVTGTATAIVRSFIFVW